MIKKLIFLSVLFTAYLNAYSIGGAYATLIDCEWTQYGYDYGYVGTYELHGEYYKIFFGDDYCEY